MLKRLATRGLCTDECMLVDESDSDDCLVFSLARRAPGDMAV